MPEETLMHSSARWGTMRHKIAASLLVYGYKLCQEQPFLIMRDPDGKVKDGVSIWFQPAHPTPEIVPESCADWESAWIKPEKWKALKETPEGRVWSFMRGGLDARDYLIQHAIRGGKCQDPIPADAFMTENLDLAACLAALRWHVYNYSCGAFAFRGEARSVVRAYENDSDVKHVIRWAKWALIQSNILARMIASAGNIPQLGFRHGDKAAVFPVCSPPAIREPLIKALMG